MYVNSLAPGKFELKFRHVICKQILVLDGWGISCEIALIWMSLDFTDDQSTLVKVMAWCRQATSRYLSQCWPRYLSPYGVTRPQWVNNQWRRATAIFLFHNTTIRYISRLNEISNGIYTFVFILFTSIWVNINYIGHLTKTIICSINL